MFGQGAHLMELLYNSCAVTNRTTKMLKPLTCSKKLKKRLLYLVACSRFGHIFISQEAMGCKSVRQYCIKQFFSKVVFFVEVCTLMSAPLVYFEIRL